MACSFIYEHNSSCLIVPPSYQIYSWTSSGPANKTTCLAEPKKKTSDGLNTELIVRHACAQAKKKEEGAEKKKTFLSPSRPPASIPADRHGFHQQYEICFVKKYSLYTVVMLKLFLLFALVCRIPEILHFLLPPPPREGEEGSASAVLAFPPATSKSSSPPPLIFFHEGQFPRYTALPFLPSLAQLAA